MPDISDKLLLTERDVSELYSIPVKTLQGWRVTGTGPHFCKLGSCVRYRPRDMDEFIEARLRRSTSVAVEKPAGPSPARRAA